MREHIIDTTEAIDYHLTPFDGYCEVWGEIREEIVRCKDCEHAIELESGMFDCTSNLVETWDYTLDKPKINIVPPNGFCFCGKRKKQK